MVYRKVFAYVLCLGVILIGAGRADAALIPNLSASCNRGPASGFSLPPLFNGAGLPGDVPALDGLHYYATAATVLWRLSFARRTKSQ